MERSEPTLVPEWLKNTGSSTGGGSISHTDDHSASRVSKNKSFANNNGHDFGRSLSSERTIPLYSRRSSSSNSSGNFRSYSSFSRNHRDRDWGKDTYDYRNQDKSVKGDHRYHEFSDPIGNTSARKFESDGLRCSESMVSGKHGDKWPKRVVANLSDAIRKNTSGVVATRGSPVGGVNKAAFEREFPTLGTDERAVTPEARRVPSPGLNNAIQSLHGIGGEKWTSALAEVPILVGNNGANLSPVLQSAPPSSETCGASSSTTSLNMAGAVAQGSSRAQAAPQLSTGTQRLEELVIKQSRQLIPVIPSMAKTLTLNSSDKQKSKVGPLQHHPISSSPISHSPRGEPGKSDIPKTSSATVGKLQVLKLARDKNGVTPYMKDNLSPTSGAKAAGSPLVSALPHRKPVQTVLEKRPTTQARSRNDFFNLMRKKSMESPSPATESDGLGNSSSPVGPDVFSPTFSDKNAELQAMQEDCKEKVDRCNVDGKKYIINGKKHLSCDPIILEEEEAAFLRSLGWEENEEEGGLTDEEISSFYRDITKYINSKPSLKILQGVQLKFMLPLDLQIKVADEIPDSKLES